MLKIEIKKFILSNNNNIDFCLCEIGGTVGDNEGATFFGGDKTVSNELKKYDMLLFNSSYISAAGEVKLNLLNILLKN